MKPIPLIRASGAIAFTKPLGEAGAPVERLWARAGISPAALEDGERLIPLESLIRFAETAAFEQGVADLGLLVAERSEFESIGTFGLAVRQAPTLRKAIETAIGLVSAYDSGERVWAVPEGDDIRLCRRARAQAEDFRQADLFTVGLMVQLIRLVAGPDWRPSRVELQSLGPVATGASDLISGARIVTGRAVTSVTFRRALLYRALPALPAPTGAARDRWAGEDQPAALRDYLASIHQVIAVLVGSNAADVGAVSRAAGTSVRSLQRSLAAAGTSYSEVLDQVRQAEAIRLLEDPDYRIIEAALALGYSDQAHFTRAFRRWTAMSPAEYRRGLRVDRRGQGLTA